LQNTFNGYSHFSWYQILGKKLALKNIGLGTALVLCIAAVVSGYYLFSGPLIGSISIGGRGWADTLGSFLAAGIVLAGVYAVAFILIAVGAFGTLIIIISVVAAKLNSSISAEDNKMVKWALGMLTVKKLLLASTSILLTIGAAYYVLDEYNANIRSSFFDATRNGNLERTKSLLRWGKFSELEVIGLEYAAESGHLEIVELLIKEGFPVERRGLQKAAQEGHMDVVMLLIENGAKVQEIDIDWVARGGHTEIFALLLEKGAVLQGTGALYFAAGHGHTDMVALLIDAGVETRECTSNDAYEPVRVRCVPVGLRAAINARNLEIARMLIEAGANVLGPANLGGRTFVQLAMGNGAEMRQLLESAIELPLAINVLNAAQNGDWERLKRVVALGAEVNETETSFDATYGWSTLMYAADQGLVEVVKILLEAGADVDYVSPADASAMSLAIANKHEEVMELLVTAGAGK
jgi:ankyrin repeat protein